MSEPLINVELLFGHVKLVQTQEVRGSKILMGGYAIHYDRFGNEIKRTPNEWNCSIECWTQKEAKRLAVSATVKHE